MSGIKPAPAQARQPSAPVGPQAGTSSPTSRSHRRSGYPGQHGLEWTEAQADARALSSSIDPRKLSAGLLRAADAVVIVLASASAFLMRYGPEAPPPSLVVATGLAALFMARSPRGGGLPRSGVPSQLLRVLRSWTSTMVCLLVVAYLTRTSEDYGRLWATAWYAFALAGLCLVRIAASVALARRHRRGVMARIVAVVDLDGSGPALARRLSDEPGADIHLLGVFTPAWAADMAAAELATAESTETRALGVEHDLIPEPYCWPPAPASTIGDLVALSQLFRIDDVLVTTSWPGHPATSDVLRRLSMIPTTVRLCPVLPIGISAPSDQAELLFGSPTLVVCRRPLLGWHAVLKRVEDLVIGSLMLVALTPVMLMIALAIRVESPGPALFRQKRLGFNNNPLTVYKFRSMTHQPIQDEVTVVQASRHDPRVTRLGRLLRRTSLDELPQLFNVLRGEMSLVGPRPHAVAHNAYYAGLIDNYLGRHRVQPGITGWAQVNGLRGETDTLDKMRKRVEFDLAYIERWSILFDLRILVQTALGALFQRQAY